MTCSPHSSSLNETVHGPLGSLLVLTFSDSARETEKSERVPKWLFLGGEGEWEQLVRGIVGLWHVLVGAGATSVFCGPGAQPMPGLEHLVLCK